MWNTAGDVNEVACGQGERRRPELELDRSRDDVDELLLTVLVPGVDRVRPELVSHDGRSPGIEAPRANAGIGLALGDRSPVDESSGIGIDAHGFTRPSPAWACLDSDVATLAEETPRSPERSRNYDSRRVLKAPALGLLGTVGVGPAELGALAARAEEAGFSGVWMVEFEYDTFPFDQVIAMHTSRITTGSCVARRFTRHPLLIAETATVIEHLAPGRFVIGLGNGGVSEPADDAAAARAKAAAEVDPSSLQRWGEPGDRPVARMREAIEVVRLALAGGRVDYLGEFYRFDGVELSLRPERTIPIYVGARRPAMLRLAGSLADGVFLWLVGTEATREAVAVVQGAALEAGRRGEDVEIGCLVPTCIHADGEFARGAMKRLLVEFYLGRGVYSDVLVRSGFAEAADRVQELTRQGDTQAAAAAVPDEALDELAIAGTPEQCRAQLEGWYGRGLGLLVLYVFPADGDWPHAYRRIVVDLAPGA